jgi:hypothetical protein
MEVLAWAHGRILGPAVLLGILDILVVRTLPGSWVEVCLFCSHGWVDGWTGGSATGVDEMVEGGNS